MSHSLIEKAFFEDRPSGDATTDALGVSEKYGMARLIAKEDLILSGRKLFEDSLHFLDSHLQVKWQFKDGEEILNRQVVAQIEGNLIQLIQAERVALNFLGYLSGIATQTRHFVDSCQGTTCKILDTRKTIPLYRELSKQAVVDGGGSNHRMGLSDAILIKENHIQIAGDFKKCIEQVRSQTHLPIEVEVKNLEEVQWAVELKVQRIMLDNMNLEQMKQALLLIPSEIETEASGNMTLERIPQVAALGVDFISVGALTHSVKNADLSLLFDWS